MTVVFDLNDQILPLLRQILLTVNQMESKMAELDDKLAKVNADVDALVTRVNGDLQNQAAKITDLTAANQKLQDQLANAQLTDPQRQALDDLDAKVNAVDAAQPAPLVAPPAA
jgi:DNA anti-recombination protein RmuC